VSIGSAIGCHASSTLPSHPSENIAECILTLVAIGEALPRTATHRAVPSLLSILGLKRTYSICKSSVVRPDLERTLLMFLPDPSSLALIATCFLRCVPTNRRLPTQLVQVSNTSIPPTPTRSIPTPTTTTTRHTHQFTSTIMGIPTPRPTAIRSTTLLTLSPRTPLRLIQLHICPMVRYTHLTRLLPRPTRTAPFPQPPSSHGRGTTTNEGGEAPSQDHYSLVLLPITRRGSWTAEPRVRV
jgi:hypothetical protein